MHVPLLDLRAQYESIRDEVRAALDEVCESQRFILGPKVEAFEGHVAQYCGCRHAVGMSSGTDALLASFMALGVGPGDAVITTPFTFFATAGSIVRVGATPVFVDIDAASFSLAPGRVEALLEAWPARFKDLKPRALLPVHLFGQCADMDPLLDIARRHKLFVIEDACQSIGAEYPAQDGVRRAGAMGEAGCFSFFPSKNLGGFGDGGMVTTNSAELAEKLRIMRDHGAKPKYHHRVVGGNFRLDTLQAAVLDVKLRRLETWHAGRRRNADRYDRALAGSGARTPAAVFRNRGITNYHIYNQYVIRVRDRDRVKQVLQDSGVATEIYYPVPLHLQECFRGLRYREGDFPESEQAAREVLALPVYPELTPEMLDHVAGVVRSAAA